MRHNKMINEKWRISGEMNLSARNTLLLILERKGIQIRELEEAIETLYESFCDRMDESELARKEIEYKRRKLLWEHHRRMRQWEGVPRTGDAY